MVQKVIAGLAITGYQVLIPLLAAAASSKDVTEKELMFKGILSDLMEEIKRKIDDQVKKSNRAKAQAQKIGLKEFRISTQRFRML